MEMYKYFSGSVSFPPKHLIFSSSFEHTLDLFCSLLIIFKLGFCPASIWLDQFHILVHTFPLHLRLTNRIPQCFYFWDSGPDKIAKWVKFISNVLQSCFSLSDFLLGNSHNRGDTPHCSVLTIHPTEEATIITLTES